MSTEKTNIADRRTVKELHGHRVVGYYESPTTRTVVVAVSRPYDYAIYILRTNADKDVDDDTETINLWRITTSVELSRQFINLVITLS